MRIPNWPALVCGWVLAALLGQSLLAAGPDDEFAEASALTEAGDDSGLIGDSAGLGIPYQPAQFAEGRAYGGYGGGFAPPAGGYNAPMLPAQNAWPETSPFTQHRIEENYNEGGLWNYNSDDNFAPKRIFSLDYLYGHGAKTGTHVIGDANLRNTPFDPDDTSILLFPSQTTSLYGPMFHDGVRVSYGFENPDNSGLMMSGFILFENSQSNGQFIGDQGPGFLQAIASIVVNDGNGNGIALPFDTRFFQKFTQEIMGADADYYFSPFVNRPALKIKMVTGVKYLRISESFFVRGDDSGLGYDLDLPPTTVFDDSFYVINNPYSTIINSSTTSNLIGPVLGVRYDLGGDKFKLWGQSKFGVMADIESRSVSSAGLNQFKVAVPEAVIDPNVLPGPAAGTSPRPTRVTSNNTHMAALFDQQFMLETPIFAMIPLVNRVTLLRESNFRVGWQYVVVSEIARPANQINYFINEPNINARRTWFSYNTFNFGLNWKW